MTSFAEFVFTEAVKIFNGDVLILGILILTSLAALMFISRTSLSVTFLITIVILDGFVGFNYAIPATYTGAFNQPIFVLMFMLAYLAILAVITFVLIRFFNR